MDLLEELVLYAKPHILSFQGRRVEDRPDLFQSDYEVKDGLEELDFYAHGKRLYVHQKTIPKPVVRIKHHQATFMDQNYRCVFDFLTGQLTRTPYQLADLTQIKKNEYPYYPSVRGQGVLYYQHGIHYRESATADPVLVHRTSGWTFPRFHGSKFLVIQTDWGTTTYYNVKTKEVKELTQKFPKKHGYGSLYLQGNYLLCYKNAINWQRLEDNDEYYINEDTRPDEQREADRREHERSGLHVIDLTTGLEVVRITLEDSPYVDYIQLAKTNGKFCLRAKHNGNATYYQ